MPQRGLSLITQPLSEGHIRYWDRGEALSLLTLPAEVRDVPP